MKEGILALMTGTFVGGLFSIIKLPIPAPKSISGILGIVGIFIGYTLVQKYFNLNG